MIDLLNDLIGRVEGLVIGGISLMALVMIGVTWAKTRSFVPVVGAVIFAALVIWGVHNVDFLQERIGEDIEVEQ